MHQEAAEHYRMAITIGEKSPGLQEHPDLAVWYFNLARMLGMQVWRRVIMRRVFARNQPRFQAASPISSAQMEI